jgi:transcriptional enhancer factor
MPNNIVYIDLLRPGSSINDNDGPFWTSPSQVAEERSLSERGYRIVRATDYPRHLRDIDPTITLLSHSMSNARSYFTVHSGDRLIFSESTTLEPVDPSKSNVDGLLYKTLLVPGFWDTIIHSPDASQYTIIQRVVQDPCSSFSSSPPPTIFSAIYKFLYQSSTPTVENFATSHMLMAEPVRVEQNDDFCLESLLSMDAEVYPDLMGFVKAPDFFDIDFTMEPNWSEQCSPDHSGFSSPCQFPQLVNCASLPDEDVQLLSPGSSFGIDTPNYL